MQVIYELTQANVFKLGRSKEDKTRIVTILFPQPALPAVEYQSGPRKAKRMAIQNNMEACNLARRQTTASTTKNSNICDWHEEL